MLIELSKTRLGEVLSPNNISEITHLQQKGTGLK
jgi:hypothetical protein